MPRKAVLSADVKRVALVVVEEAKAGRRRGAGGNETAGDAPETESQLVGVREIELGAMANARGAQREFPTVDARALDGYGKEDLGVVEIVVIKEVSGAGEEIIGVEGPAAEGDSDAELMFFIALAMKRDEAQILGAGRLQERAGNREQRRRLIKMAIEAAENPVEFWDAQGNANPRAGGVLDDTT